MSWQQYVDEHLLCEIEGNKLSAAAIIGQDGSVWAQSSTFPQVFYFLEFLVLSFSTIEFCSFQFAAGDLIYRIQIQLLKILAFFFF